MDKIVAPQAVASHLNGTYALPQTEKSVVIPEVSPVRTEEALAEPSLIAEKTSFIHEGIRIRYLQHQKTGVVGLELVPVSKLDEMVQRPDKIELPSGSKVLGWSLQPLVGLHLLEDPSPRLFANGRTLQGSPSAEALAWHSQTERQHKNGREIVTRLHSRDHALEAEHVVRLLRGTSAVTTHTTLRNVGTTPLTLHMVTSFGLGAMTPFARDEAPGRLVLHRFRSSWSQEGRHVRDSLEHLHLEPSWTRVDLLSERFGQVGSMPVRGYFPMALLEDTHAGVFWGAQIAWLGSWQIEVLRRGDSVALVGGLADFEFGHWQKTLAPGESFETPAAHLTCGAGDLDATCDALLQAQRMDAAPVPASEDDLPILYNEYCLTWGLPTEKSMFEIAERLKDSPIKYIVIDAGWSKRPKGYGEQGANGDWRVDTKKFPRGFGHLNAALRANNQKLGIWFEFEVTTEGADVYAMVDHQLKRLDRVLQVGQRRFWDFRDPWVQGYLTERVIEFLRSEGFGYLKVDYNDTVGPGCDSPDGLGEGLRAHLCAVHGFFRKIAAELPDLVIENCASGGHRLEPLMVGSSAMSSFSDAHEGPEIPWIGANLQRLIPPEKMQIWAVLRPGDTSRRLHYTMSAGLLGRLCLSGDVAVLTADQWAVVEEGMRFYRKVWPIIRHGSSRRFGMEEQCSQRLGGYQAVRRVSTDQSQILVVWHSFAAGGGLSLRVPLPSNSWKILDQYNREVRAIVKDSALEIEDVQAFSGGAVWLKDSAVPLAFPGRGAQG